MTMQIKRTLTPGNPPPALAQGQLGVEMASDPPALWCGVPVAVNAAGRVLLNEKVTPAGPSSAISGAVQFNNNGAFGGTSDFIYYPGAQVLDSRNLQVSGGGGYTRFSMPAGEFTQAINTTGTGWDWEARYSASRMEFSSGNAVGTANFPPVFEVNKLSNTFRFPDKSVATLPAAAPNFRGARATVNDALSRTGIVAGGGAFTIPVFCDGTNWRANDASACLPLTGGTLTATAQIIWPGGLLSANFLQLAGAIQATANTGVVLYGTTTFSAGANVNFSTGTIISFQGGLINMANLPTTNPGVVGNLWNNGGVLTVSAG